MKVGGLNSIQLSLLVRAHLLMSSPILAHEKNLSILLNCGCILDILEDMMAKSSMHVAVLMVVFEVLNA